MNKRGLSLIVFVVSIAVVLTLATVITTSYNVILDSARIREYGNELNQIQKAVDEYNFLNNEYPILEEYTLNLELIDSASREEQFGKTSGTVEFYIIDLQKLGVYELHRGIPTNIETRDTYAILKETGKVYYLAGLNIDNKWYYTLTDEIKSKLDV